MINRQRYLQASSKKTIEKRAEQDIVSFFERIRAACNIWNVSILIKIRSLHLISPFCVAINNTETKRTDYIINGLLHWCWWIKCNISISPFMADKTPKNLYIVVVYGDSSISICGGLWGLWRHRKSWTGTGNEREIIFRTFYPYFPRFFRNSSRSLVRTIEFWIQPIVALLIFESHQS